jgi:hypothetical protein
MYLLVLSYPLSFAVLLTIPTTARNAHDYLCAEPSPAGGRWRVVVVLDSVLVVGALGMLCWLFLVPEPDVDPTLPAIISANTAGNLVLVVTVMLLVSFRRPRSPMTFSLLAAGLAAYSMGNAWTGVSGLTCP